LNFCEDIAATLTAAIPIAAAVSTADWDTPAAPKVTALVGFAAAAACIDDISEAKLIPICAI
jgi:hypothetical protein